MPKLAPTPVSLTELERTELQKLVNRYQTPQRLALRARIILLTDEGKNHGEITRALNISKDMARLWRHRWLETSVKNLPVAKRLEDVPRPGAPLSFT